MSSETAEQPAAQALAEQILADRFEVIAEPLAWRCRGCKVTVAAKVADSQHPQGQPIQSELDRLAEAAADHALYCGRCDD